jgi:hypothetical protein
LLLLRILLRLLRILRRLLRILPGLLAERSLAGNLA